MACAEGHGLTRQVGHVSGWKKCKKNEKGLVLFGPCWANLGLNSDLNGAKKKVGIGLGLNWG